MEPNSVPQGTWLTAGLITAQPTSHTPSPRGRTPVRPSARGGQRGLQSASARRAEAPDGPEPGTRFPLRRIGGGVHAPHMGHRGIIKFFLHISTAFCRQLCINLRQKACFSVRKGLLLPQNQKYISHEDCNHRRRKHGRRHRMRTDFGSDH